MLTIGDKQYRNLQEQVLQNQSDIQYLLKEGGTLNEFGIKVVGAVQNESDLPDPETYEGEYGDAYAVGSNPPYTFYIWTRQISGQEGSFWFSIGQFPVPSTVPGPQGIQGPQGPTGERGSIWFSGQGIPGASGGGTIITGAMPLDKYLRTNTGDIYTFNGSTWNLIGNIKGPQGNQGANGIQGPQGAQGPQGPQGPAGAAGQSIIIVGTVANTTQLPAPASIPRSSAYLVGSEGNYDLYVITGTDNLLWTNAGNFGGGTDVIVDSTKIAEIDLTYVNTTNKIIDVRGKPTTITNYAAQLVSNTSKVGTGNTLTDVLVLGDEGIYRIDSVSGDLYTFKLIKDNKVYSIRINTSNIYVEYFEEPFLEIDMVVTEGSTNPVESGAVYDSVKEVDAKIAAIQAVMPAPTPGLTYAPRADKPDEYQCTGIGTAQGSDIVVAAVYDGHLVTRIANAAFRNNAQIVNVTLPDTLIETGDYVFQNCKTITTVNIPDNVIEIGTSVFAECTSLTIVNISPFNKVKSIGNYAFYRCPLERFYIGSMVESIGQYALGRTNLTEIMIPKSVISMGQRSIGTQSLITIRFNGDVPAMNALPQTGKVSTYDFRFCTAVPPLSNAYLFGRAINCQILVPSALYDEWIAAENWAQLKNIIVRV